MEFSIEMSLPLDSNGFLRRQCPACDREFKWLHTESDGATEENLESQSYFCPYCGGGAPADEWWTQDQLAAIEGAVFDEVVEPEVDKLRRQASDIGRSSGGLLSMDVTVQRDEVPVLHEGDMTRIDFDCHPEEPVKVVESWVEPVFCLTCGKRQNRQFTQ
jgi:hypothetical protein